jgi:predicted DNA repair protein MutK
MPGSGLIALLDDIATIADDVATLTAAAAKKSSGIVTDDMAVTAEQAIGIRREREIPVVLAVARGSFLNKALYLAPGALLLNAVAPWAITPLLMAGGAFLCFEGVEKILHKMTPHGEGAEDPVALAAQDPEAFERLRVEGAIRTDMILSGEIIAITLGQVKDKPFLTEVAVLYGISIIMTVGVYGLVGGLVKLDDFGEYLVQRGGGSAGIGRAIVAAAPKLLHLISIVGTVAMLMVGGQIVLHGIHPAAEAVHHLVEKLPHAVHGLASLLGDILAGGIVGGVIVAIGATGIPARVWAAVRRKPAT